MEGWMEGCVDGCVHGWMNGGVNGWMGEKMKTCMDGSIIKRILGWKMIWDGQMDGCKSKGKDVIALF